jgi:hypothetical protein
MHCNIVTLLFLNLKDSLVESDLLLLINRLVKTILGLRWIIFNTQISKVSIVDVS